MAAAGQSKHASASGSPAAEEQEEQERRRRLDQEKTEKQLVSVIGPAVFLNVLSGAMLFTARTAHAGKLFPNANALAAFLTRLGSVSAFVEFLVNPIFGKLSDTFGRKAVIPVGNFSTMICRMIMFLNPTATWPIILEQTVTIPLISSFFTTWRASVSDSLDGAAYAGTNAKIGVCAGMAIIVGPMISKTIMKVADPKYCFLASSLFSATALAHLTMNFKESLPPAQRKPLVISDMQPFSFVQMMQKSRLLAKLMWITGIQTTSEGRNVNDIFSIYMQKDLGWSWDQINNFVGALGVSLVISGVGAKRALNAMGAKNFTTLSNLCNATSMFSYSYCSPFSQLVSPGGAMALGLVFAIPGARKRDAVEALIMKKGSEAGLGKGFMSGALMNWRAVINIIGPVLFGSMYTYGSRKHFPGLVFFVAALTCVGAEALTQTIPKDVFEDRGKPATEAKAA